MFSYQQNEKRAYYKLSFKLAYEEGINSIFYKSRNIQEDFKKIFNLIRFDILFISHKCELTIDTKQNSCSVKINDLNVLSTDKHAQDE